MNCLTLIILCKSTLLLMLYIMKCYTHYTTLKKMKARRRDVVLTMQVQGRKLVLWTHGVDLTKTCAANTSPCLYACELHACIYITRKVCDSDQGWCEFAVCVQLYPDLTHPQHGCSMHVNYLDL